MHLYVVGASSLFFTYMPIRIHSHIHVRTYTHPHTLYIICIDGHCFAEYFNLKLLAVLWTLKGSGTSSNSNIAGV